jgi:hypothetical protein
MRSRRPMATIARLGFVLALLISGHLVPMVPAAGQTVTEFIRVRFACNSNPLPPNGIGTNASCSTTPAGTIHVRGDGFAPDNCDSHSAQFHLINTATPTAPPIFLGSAFICGEGQAEGTFPVPSSVGLSPPTFRVRMTVPATPTAVVSLPESAVISIVPAAGPGVLTGTAQCNLPPLTPPLAGARVELWSGSALVATTIAATPSGSFTFTGLAPQSSYTLRFTQNTEPFPTFCGVPVTTNSDGVPTVGGLTPCPTPNHNNRTWLTPQAVPATSQGAVITDFICAAGQSRWFRVPIEPGQQVTAEVLDPAFDVTLALFTDISKVQAEM